MNGIVGTIGHAGRRDLFYLDKDFQMKQRYWNGTEWVIDWVELGGIFTSVPAAVSSMGVRPTRPGMGDIGDVVHDLEPVGEAPPTRGPRAVDGVIVGEFTPTLDAGSAAVDGSSSPLEAIAAAEPLIPASAPDVGEDRVVFTGTGALQQRIDVFGLGLDYALYQKTLWGAAVDRKDRWSNLGGVFTSAPAAIWVDDRLHVFGLGTDLAMYHRSWHASTGWSDGWARIGGYFSSTPVVVSWGSGRLDVFARGADFSLRHRLFEDGAWAGDWQNLGGALASEPAVVTWGEDRIDIFAVGNLDGVEPDGGLIHRWWDGDIWNDWEQIAGKSTGDDVAFTSAPAAASWSPGRLDVFAVDTEGTLRHVWFGDSAWSNPEQISPVTKMRSTPLVLATGPTQLEMIAPGRDHNMWRKTLTGAAWDPLNWWQLGDRLRLPSQYRFSIDLIRADTPRSLNSDTVTGQCTLKVGNWPNAVLSDLWPLLPKTQRQGDLGNLSIDEGQTNLMNFDPVTIELHETAAFNYTFVNSNEPDDAVEAALKEQAVKLADWAAKSVVNASASGLSLTAVQVGALAAPLTGSLLGVLTGWLTDALHDVIVDKCDGPVANEQYVRRGDDLHRMTVGGDPVTMTVMHRGTGSPVLCGAKSEYDVFWSIRAAKD